jgi:hypothetical protein
MTMLDAFIIVLSTPYAEPENASNVQIDIHAFSDLFPSFPLGSNPVYFDSCSLDKRSCSSMSLHAR